jgi:hypothetical protein
MQGREHLVESLECARRAGRLQKLAALHHLVHVLAERFVVTGAVAIRDVHALTAHLVRAPR